MSSPDDDPKTIFRRAVYSTTLGVRAKLVLIALADVGTAAGLLVEIPPDGFYKIRKWVTRPLSRIIRTMKVLEDCGVVVIAPSEAGYLINFHPENERRYPQEKVEKGARHD